MLVAVLTLALGAAGAQPSPRFEAAFSVGIAFPFGDAVEGEALHDTTPRVVPLGLELGLRFTPTVYAGLFGQYGFVRHARECYSCVDHVLRLGAEAVFHLSPGAALDPWLGVGVGIEFPSDAERSERRQTDPTYDPVVRQLWGPMLQLQAGLDVALGNHLSVGPWLGILTGAYTSHSDGIPDQGLRFDTYSTAMHWWLSAGVRFALRS